jgi:ferredoxin
MNDNCSACAGSPMCMTECPVDCIHIMYDETFRPLRGYVDYDTCIGCLNCFSFEIRPKNVNKGDPRENMAIFNDMDLMSKSGVCPWDAIEIHPFEEGRDRSETFHEQPKKSLKPAPAGD